MSHPESNKAPLFALVQFPEAHNVHEARMIAGQQHEPEGNAVADWLLNAAAERIPMAVGILSGRKIAVFTGDSARIVEIIEEFLCGSSKGPHDSWDPDTYVAVRI